MMSLFFYAFILSLLSLLIVIYLSHKHTLFIDDGNEDKPQKFHDTHTPRAGGIGVLMGMTLLILTPFGLKFIFSILLAFLSGIFEDFHHSLSPRRRLALQLFSAFTAIYLVGSVVTYLGLGITMPYGVAIIFSAFAIVGMMNAINIIDGFNGLASGVILFILTSFAIITYQHQHADMLQIISIVAGSTAAFFILNFPKGKIFLGDGGAYLLGFIIAVIGIFLASTYNTVSPWYILALFIYPVWEVLFSIGRKLSIGLSPMQPDSYHLHMLIHRQITKNNPLTTLFILLSILPSTVLATIYAHSSIYNIIISLLFILGYSLLYRYLIQKDSSSKTSA